MRTSIRWAMPFLLLAAFLGAFATAAAAQDAQDQNQDPPSRVARLNYLEGSVSFQVQGDSDWVAADPNRPLTTGDNLWADKDSRGEVHIDSTAIRLSSETGLSFLNLDDRTVQLQLPQGTIEVHLRQLAPGDAFEVDTPNLAFTATKAGEYVIGTDPNGGSTTITVREGEGQVTGGGDSWTLSDGQQYSFNGTDQLAYAAQQAADFSDFEAWCQDRDQRENNSVSAKYVSRDVDGYYDLDQYGDWGADADYGEVWYPRGVAADWVPYHVGHWVYIAPWGWTWVDEEPWGFAPFHYGRWVMVGPRWGWVPGPVVVRPVYAPALVGFVGGAGFGLSVSIGGGFTGVAWFPLGPRDVFVPAYHCSPHYVQYVNVTNTRVVNVTQVTNVYNTVIVNRDVTHVNYTYAGNVHAVTAVSRETFVGARPVAAASVHITDDQFKQVRVVSNTTIAPTRASYVAANAKVVTARPAVPFSQRPVVANLPPRVPVQSRPAQGPANNGFRSFGEQTNNNANNHAQIPQTHNEAPATSNPVHPAPRVLEEQGTPRDNAPTNNALQPKANQPPANNNGFRPFTPPNGSASRGNTPANGTNAGNAGQAQPGAARGTQQPNNTNTNQNANQDRYHFSPPVKANDNNYDVHPPLNQKNENPKPPAHDNNSKPPKETNSNSKSH
jgi:hypothetical protein